MRTAVGCRRPYQVIDSGVGPSVGVDISASAADHRGSLTLDDAMGDCAATVDLAHIQRNVGGTRAESRRVMCAADDWALPLCGRERGRGGRGAVGTAAFQIPTQREKNEKRKRV